MGFGLLSNTIGTFELICSPDALDASAVRADAARCALVAKGIVLGTTVEHDPAIDRTPGYFVQAIADNWHTYGQKR